MIDKSKVEILTAEISDFEMIREIYAAGIETENATFVTVCGIPNADEWFAGKVKNSVKKAVADGEIVGWYALSNVKDTCAYAGVAEVSVYVSPKIQGGGIGSLLMQHLVEFAENNNIWTLQAGIFPENEPSIKLHEKFGFRIVGIREKIGKLNDKWRDVTLLERRSQTIF